MHHTLRTDQSIPSGSCPLGMLQRFEFQLVYQMQCYSSLASHLDGLTFSLRNENNSLHEYEGFFMSISLTYVEHFKLWH